MQIILMRLINMRQGRTFRFPQRKAKSTQVENHICHRPILLMGQSEHTQTQNVRGWQIEC